MVALDAHRLLTATSPTTSSAVERRTSASAQPTCAKTVHNVGLLSNTYASTSACARPIFARRKTTRGRSASTSIARTSSRTKRSRVTTSTAARAGTHAAAVLLSSRRRSRPSRLADRHLRRRQLADVAKRRFELRFALRSLDRIHRRLAVQPAHRRQHLGRRQETLHVYLRPVLRRAAARRRSPRLRAASQRLHDDASGLRSQAREATRTTKRALVHTFNPHFTGSLNIFRKTVVNILDTTQLLNTPMFAVFNNAIGIDNGVELRLQDRLLERRPMVLYRNDSGSYAACVSGFDVSLSAEYQPPGVSCVAQLSLEDHDETVVSTAGVHVALRDGPKQWFATLQGNYGSGFPVAFEDANVNSAGRLPAHTTFDLAAGRTLTPGTSGEDHGLGRVAARASTCSTTNIRSKSPTASTRRRSPTAVTFLLRLIGAVLKRTKLMRAGGAKSIRA